MTQYWGSTRHFFLLILYNFKNIGGGGARAPRPPYSAVPAKLFANSKISTLESGFKKLRLADLHANNFGFCFVGPVVRTRLLKFNPELGEILN